MILKLIRLQGKILVNKLKINIIPIINIIAISHDIFNVPVRNDIIHRVYIYNKDYNRRTFKWVMSKGDVAGSNKKPFRQKKTGRAPQGDKRAPHLYHGGSAHGARPQQFYFPLNKRVRIFGKKHIVNILIVYRFKKFINFQTNTK